MKSLGILGVGKMGGAILDGIISSGLYKKEDLLLCDSFEGTLDTLKKQGFDVTPKATDLFEACEVILLSIKPQMFPEVLGPAKDYDFTGKGIITIAAGMTIDYVETFFKNAKIVRVMPNTPAQIKCAVATVCTKDKNNPYFEKAMAILNSIGVAYEIEESQMDDSLALNGSMPAYLYLFAKAFIDQAAKDGIDYETAKKLAAESIISSAKMILQSKDDLDTLIKNVCSKGGTTIAGLNELYDNGFEEAIYKCAKACANRSRELSK